MTLSEKIRKWLTVHNVKQSRLAKEVGIGTGNMTTIMKTNSCSLDAARRIASKMKVSVDWLSDPEKGWPPSGTAADVDDIGLSYELFRRRRSFLREFGEYHARWKSTNWKKVYSWCEENALGSDAPAEVADGLNLLRFRLRFLQQYNILWMISLGASFEKKEEEFTKWATSQSRPRSAWTDKVMMHVYPRLHWEHSNETE